MGCASSSETKEEPFEGGDQTKTFKAPRSWKHDKLIGPTKLAQMRAEFWDTAPHYGGLKEIWEALKAASESVIAGDLNMAHIIVESAGITVVRDDMTACYDERGNKYDLPKFVLSKPSNVVKDEQVPPESPKEEERLAGQQKSIGQQP